jgi:thermitase
VSIRWRGSAAWLTPILVVSGLLAAPRAPAAAITLPAERVIVTFERGTSSAERERTIASMGGEIARVVDEQRVAVHVDGEERVRLAGNARVATIEPDVIYRVANTPNDPCYTNCFGITQWALQHLGAPSAWDIVPGTSTPVRVAVLDTGVRSTHPDFGGRVTRLSDFSSDSSTAADLNGHGTTVAGVIAATGNNGVGIAGVSWGAEIRSFKVLDDRGAGYASDAAAALRAASDEGARVVNMSFAGEPSSALQSAVSYAQSKGALIVAAAGNDGSTTPMYPAAYSGVVGVAATTQSDTLASFSNRGTWITLAAPGVNIATTTTSSGYNAVTGTSYASPLVAGAAALLWLTTYGPNAGSVRSRLVASAQPIGANAGAGLLQLDAALDGAQLTGPCAPTQPGYLLDGWGGVHAASGAPAVSASAYWRGWDIARDITTRPGGGGWVLDGWGGLHPFGGAPGVAPSASWPGWDIARAVARAGATSGYVLDGWGGLHPFGGAPAATASASWPGWDIARDAVMRAGGGGWVLDGYGGVHPFGGAPAVTTTGAWPGADVARRVVLDQTGTRGWVLDINGGMHRFAPVGTALPESPPNPLAPQVPARDAFAGAGAGFFLTGQGSVGRFGAPACVAFPSWPGWDIARAFAPAL